MKPQNETSSESRAMMTIPTVALMVVPSLTADRACPPMMESTMEKPVSVARFSKMKSETKYLLGLLARFVANSAWNEHTHTRILPG